jgi:hypothetical protein
LGTLFTLIVGFLGGVFGAVAIDFVRTPLREFFTRRTEIRDAMLRLANVPPPDPTWTAPTYSDEAIDRLLRPSREAEATLRSLGSRMIAFGDTEWIAVEIVRYLGFDPLKAGYGLIGLSNSLAQYGEERATHRASINKALRFRD